MPRSGEKNGRAACGICASWEASLSATGSQNSALSSSAATLMTSLAQWKRSASKESAALQAYSRRCRRTRGVQILAMHASEQGNRIHHQQAVSAKPKLLWVGEHQDHLCLAAPRRMQALLTQLALQPVQGRVPLGGQFHGTGCQRWCSRFQHDAMAARSSSEAFISAAPRWLQDGSNLEISNCMSQHTCSDDHLLFSFTSRGRTTTTTTTTMMKWW